MSPDEVSKQYKEQVSYLEAFRQEFVKQLEHLVNLKNVTLAMPLESRVKSLDSIVNKFSRRQYKHDSITDLDDLVGVRVILLFKEDLDLVTEAFDAEFLGSVKENKTELLEESEFGYSSVHYTVSLPKEWVGTPALRRFANYRVEIQVRTLAQHIWAAASHKLQYKSEENIPKELRRSMSRLSAHLETVDFELDRIKRERETYLSKIDTERDKGLDVDILKAVLDEWLPPENKDVDEDYDNLLTDLRIAGINTIRQLTEFISLKVDNALAIDDSIVRGIKSGKDNEDEHEPERFEKAKSKNAYLGHVNLIWSMIHLVDL